MAVPDMRKPALAMGDNVSRHISCARVHMSGSVLVSGGQTYSKVTALKSMRFSGPRQA